MQSLRAEKQALLEVVMERDFAAFGNNEMEEFLEDLADLTGLATDAGQLAVAAAASGEDKAARAARHACDWHRAHPQKRLQHGARSRRASYYL